MKYDILLIGVGGEGSLTSQVIIARAANLEGYYVRGVQLHGLAQRGGSAPTQVRFGSKNEVFSPSIMQANADLVIAFDPLEAIRAVFWARPTKTNFIINNDPYPTIYSHILRKPYPKKDIVEKKIEPWARSVYTISATEIAKEKFKNPILSNTILLGVAKKLDFLPIKKENLIKSLKMSAPRDIKENLAAFNFGLEYSKKD